MCVSISVCFNILIRLQQTWCSMYYMYVYCYVRKNTRTWLSYLSLNFILTQAKFYFWICFFVLYLCTWVHKIKREHCCCWDAMLIYSTMTTATTVWHITNLFQLKLFDCLLCCVYVSRFNSFFAIVVYLNFPLKTTRSHTNCFRIEINASKEEEGNREKQIVCVYL